MKQEEKLEEAKRLYQTANADQKYVLEKLFPELQESEDERIRKTLIENFKWFCGDFPETTKWGKDDDLLVKDIISWLEKLAPTSKWTEEDEKRLDHICNFVWKNRKGDTDEIFQQEQDVDWLKSLKPRIGG